MIIINTIAMHFEKERLNYRRIIKKCEFRYKEQDRSWKTRIIQNLAWTKKANKIDEDISKFL